MTAPSSPPATSSTPTVSPSTPRPPPPMPRISNRLKGEAPDPYTFRVTYDKPFAPALASWGTKSSPPSAGRAGYHQEPPGPQPVGTGPYRFKEWMAGQKIVLEANPGLLRGASLHRPLVYRIIPDTSTMFMELKAGGIDMMGLTPVQYARQTTTRVQPHFNKYRYPASGYIYMGYNLRNPLFEDKRVRQAITAAINKDEIIHGVLLGMGQMAHGPFKPGTWAYNPNVKDIGYDPAPPNCWPRPAGGRRTATASWSRTAGPSSSPSSPTRATQQRLKTAQIIQQRLKDVGIDVKIRIIEWASFLNQFIDKGNFEAVILGWTIAQDPDIFDVWHSSKTGPEELNFIGYKNPEVDRLLEEGRGTFDTRNASRPTTASRRSWPRTALYLPLCPRCPAGGQRPLPRIEPAPAGITHNFIKWYVPQGRAEVSDMTSYLTQTNPDADPAPARDHPDHLHGDPPGARRAGGDADGHEPQDYGRDPPAHARVLRARQTAARPVRLLARTDRPPRFRPLLSPRTTGRSSTRSRSGSPVTLSLNIIALILEFGLAIPIGILAAVAPRYPPRQGDHGLRLPRLCHAAFWLALLLMYLFGVKLDWLPISGLHSLGSDSLGTAALSLGSGETPGPAGLRRLLRQPGRALPLHALHHAGGHPPGLHHHGPGQGLSERAVIYKHALRNALLPVITISASPSRALSAAASSSRPSSPSPAWGSSFTRGSCPVTIRWSWESSLSARC